VRVRSCGARDPERGIFKIRGGAREVSLRKWEFKLEKEGDPLGKRGSGKGGGNSGKGKRRFGSLLN